MGGINFDLKFHHLKNTDATGNFSQIAIKLKYIYFLEARFLALSSNIEFITFVNFKILQQTA